MNFADAVITKVRSLGHPLCVGLDPHLDLIPPLFRRGSMAAEDPQTTLAVSELLFALLDRIAGKVAVIKPQSALKCPFPCPFRRAATLSTPLRTCTCSRTRPSGDRHAVNS